MGKRNLSILKEKKYSSKDDLMSDLQQSLDNTHIKYLKLNEMYNAIPAWGVSENADIKNVTIESQKIDKIIPIKYNNKIYYFFVIYDLKTEKSIYDLNIKGI